MRDGLSKDEANHGVNHRSLIQPIRPILGLKTGRCREFLQVGKCGVGSASEHQEFRHSSTGEHADDLAHWPHSSTLPEPDIYISNHLTETPDGQVQKIPPLHFRRIIYSVFIIFRKIKKITTKEKRNKIKNNIFIIKLAVCILFGSFEI